MVIWLDNITCWGFVTLWVLNVPSQRMEEHGNHRSVILVLFITHTLKFTVEGSHTYVRCLIYIHIWLHTHIWCLSPYTNLVSLTCNILGAKCPLCSIHVSVRWRCSVLWYRWNLYDITQGWVYPGYQLRYDSWSGQAIAECSMMLLMGEQLITRYILCYDSWGGHAKTDGIWCYSGMSKP